MRDELAAGQETDLELVVDGLAVTVRVDPATVLADALRHGGYTGTRIGCRTGDCGACTVVLDGLTVKSCLKLAIAARGCTIETVEGLGSPDRLDPTQEMFDALFAYQCGYCLPGMLLCSREAIALGATTEAELRGAIDGNLCRCTGYVNIVAALRRLRDAARAGPVGRPEGEERPDAAGRSVDLH
jgi:carbon-monoxide dehydrogenase small subunit